MPEHGGTLFRAKIGVYLRESGISCKRSYPSEAQSLRSQERFTRRKPYKLSDGQGLHVVVKPNGSILWRMKYRFLGVERLLSFGRYPQVSIHDARVKRDDALKLLAAGRDPSVQKKLDRIAADTAARTTFKLVAEEYLAASKANDAAPATLEKNSWLRLDLASPIANRAIADITPAELPDLLKRIERSGRRETAPLAWHHGHSLSSRHRHAAGNQRSHQRLEGRTAAADCNASRCHY